MFGLYAVIKKKKSYLWSNNSSLTRSSRFSRVTLKQSIIEGKPFLSKLSDECGDILVFTIGWKNTLYKNVDPDTYLINNDISFFFSFLFFFCGHTARWYFLKYKKINHYFIKTLFSIWGELHQAYSAFGRILHLNLEILFEAGVFKWHTWKCLRVNTYILTSLARRTRWATSTSRTLGKQKTPHVVNAILINLLEKKYLSHRGRSTHSLTRFTRLTRRSLETLRALRETQ